VEAGNLAVLLGPLMDKMSSERWSHRRSTIAASDAAPRGDREKITLGFSFLPISCYIFQLAISNCKVTVM
jgi:hypothetical protein